MKLSGKGFAADRPGRCGEPAQGESRRPFTPHLDVWKVGDKVFLIVTDDDPQEQIITVKVDPSHGDALRREHETITPGHYLDKRHWLSIAAGPGITKSLVKHLVHSSYELVAGALPAEARLD